MRPPEKTSWPHWPKVTEISLQPQFASHQGQKVTFFGMAQHGHVTARTAETLKSHVAITAIKIRS
jgi:hypothetical protein